MTYYRFLALYAILVTHSSFAQYLFPKQINGKSGYIDTLNQWVVPAQFDQAGFYKNGKAIASRHDSLFMVMSKDRIFYLSGLKNYAPLDTSHMAIQHKNGKWAIADLSFNPVTGFDYTRISYGDSMYRISKNRLLGLMNLQFKEVLPCNFTSIERFLNGQYKANSSNSQYIYACQRDSMIMVMKHTNIIFSDLYPRIYQSANKNKTKLVIFNMRGDSVYGCQKCAVISSFGNYIFVKQNSGVNMLNATNGELKRYIGKATDIQIETRQPAFLYLASSRELYLESDSEAVYKSEEDSIKFSYVNGRFLLIQKAGKYGLCDYRGNVLIPRIYQSIELLNDSLIRANTALVSEIYYLPLKKKILTVLPYINVSADASTILTYNRQGSSMLYSIDDQYNLTDSALFRSLNMIRAGKKTDVIGNITPNAINTSMSNRWFYSRNRFGLRGFNNDTLVRPRFSSVQTINDSIDIVTLPCGNNVLINVGGCVHCNAGAYYGIINNRTAKYIVAPSLFYIDKKHIDDTSFHVVRVILRNGRFALFNKTDYSFVPGTECTYITEEENGHMRLFYKALFFSDPDQRQRGSSRIPQRLNDLNSFWTFGGYSNARWGVYGVYVLAGAVNIADKKGDLLLDQKSASQISFLKAGKYNNFIGMNHKNQFGVMSANKGELIPFVYRAVSRLPKDDRYFVLQSDNLKYGYVNNQGTEISEALFNTAYNFREEYAWCKIGDSMLIIDKNGELTETGLPVTQVNEVAEGYTSYRTRKGWILIDAEGKRVSAEVFKKLKPFSNGSAAAMQAGKWGIIDHNGTWILPAELNAFHCDNQDAIVLSDEKHYYFYNRQGTLQNKVKMKGSIKPLGTDYFVMTQNGAEKVFHTNGEPFSRRRFRQNVRCTNDTILAVSNSGMVTYGPNGKRLMRYKHQGGARAVDKCILKLERNKAKMQNLTLMVAESQRRLHGDVFDHSVKYVQLIKPDLGSPVKLVNLQMDKCFTYNAFIYQYEEAGKYVFCLSDSLGNLLNEQLFSSLQYFGNGFFKASFYNQNSIRVTGILNAYGLWVVEPKFEDIQPFFSGIAAYSKRSDFWIADAEGQFITKEVMVDYTYSEGYYYLKTEDKMAWWHPQKGWLTDFSK